jgi:hypothetical protein
MNTVIMVAAVGMFYLIVVRGISTNQTLVVTVLFLSLSLAWLAALRRAFGQGRSN